MEQAVLLADADEVDAVDLGLQLGSSSGIRVDIPDDSLDFHEVLEEVNHLAESLLIRRALLECGGNRTRTAQRLGLSRRALLYKIQRHEID
ncbi:MAG: helix-turn-helix domain-containing protein [Myxococcota bacterium]|nr:helix-turn-helix domain-containing protein [Myxococcota bacterium]